MSDMPDVVAFEPLDIQDPEQIDLRGAHLGGGDYPFYPYPYEYPEPINGIFVDSPYPNTTLTASPILDANLPPGVPRPFADSIHTAPHTGFLGGPGIKASSLHGGANVLTLLPLTKRLIQMPIGSAIELLNAGIDWIPSPTTLASYITPTNKYGLGPAYPLPGSVPGHFPGAPIIEPYFGGVGFGEGSGDDSRQKMASKMNVPSLAGSIGMLEDAGDLLWSLGGFEAAEGRVPPATSYSSAALFQSIDI